MNPQAVEFDEAHVAARLAALATTCTLAEACETVVHELQGWTLQTDGWVPTAREVPVRRVYQIAATLANTEREHQSLQMEALFIERSASVKAAVLAVEARKRSAAQSNAAKKRTPKKLVSDEQLMQLVTQWKEKNPGRTRGMICAVALDAGITERAVRKRLSAFGTSD